MNCSVLRRNSAIWLADTLIVMNKTSFDGSVSSSDGLALSGDVYEPFDWIM